MMFRLSTWIVAVAAMFAVTSAWGQNPGTQNAAFEQKKAAEQGDAAAQFNLGVCYLNGNGVTKNSKEAYKWFRKAAEQGDAEAQHNLGICYDNGNGVTKNSKEAVKWFRMAAEQGQADAQYNLGVCYYNGLGVTKNSKEAYKWFVIAAAHARMSVKASRALDELEDEMTFDQITEAEEEAAEFSPSGD